ncbi:hypothetical protein H4696_002679 [Amycolatopsis lexingtonensis]|uniref:Uncharacterized protein n=1 Tax=Amycolatopsis lexingtonensis TaxID=218822 RepID=A0ABR9HXB4_9PSEU|nr:hypothetical protein [Amycolatopsis lexingtonensis]MBE1495579.1 hypothetical protein [Amycolatopsis lexingtonensis]
MPENEVYLVPPPRLAASAELPPHLGGLRLAPWTGELPDETEPFEAQRDEDEFTAELAERMVELALSQPKLRERLGARWQLIGVSRFRDKGDEAWSFVVTAFDYEGNRAIDAVLDGRREELVAITETVTQPPLATAEVEKAVELARGDARLDRAELAELEAMAIQVAPEGLPEAAANHRLVEVLFGACGQRLPRHRIWVDLSTEQVLKVARADRECGCGNAGGED